MKYILTMIVAMMILTACGDTKEESNETQAEIEAAMVQGREAGRAIVNRPWTDTLQLQNYILEARAQRSRYEIQKRFESAKAFDKGVVTLVYSVKPELAKQLFPDSLLNSVKNGKNE